MSSRPSMPTDIEALVLFKANHTCSICNNPNIGVQIHHIDGNSGNNSEDNLVVLCLEHHNKASSKSTMGKSFTIKELKKYKEEWEGTIRTRRESLREPTKITLVRFEGDDVNTVYLEVKPGVLRSFQDPKTFEHLGFNWGNVDVYPEIDKSRFEIEPPLQKIADCRKIRLKFQDGSLANEVYLIWEDGRKHHIPDPETLRVIDGGSIEEIDYLTFNTIPHGEPIKSIFEVRTNTLLKDAMSKHLQIHD